jgi:hypothetical protein
VATRDVFSADELAQLRGFPEIGRAELIRFFMLTPADEEFVRRFRDKRNVLGAAVQLCTLPWLGFVPEDVPARCHEVFFDQSKNNSRTWFDTAACANALNLRAYRERRKAARFSDLSERDPG